MSKLEFAFHNVTLIILPALLFIFSQNIDGNEVGGENNDFIFIIGNINNFLFVNKYRIM